MSEEKKMHEGMAVAVNFVAKFIMDAKDAYWEEQKEKRILRLLKIRKLQKDLDADEVYYNDIISGEKKTVIGLNGTMTFLDCAHCEVAFLEGGGVTSARFIDGVSINYCSQECCDSGRAERIAGPSPQTEDQSSVYESE